MDKEDKKAILEWIATRPFHELDQCVNAECRWTFSITDHGIWTDITVQDNGTPGEEGLFQVPHDSDSW